MFKINVSSPWNDFCIFKNWQKYWGSLRCWPLPNERQTSCRASSRRVFGRFLHLWDHPSQRAPLWHSSCRESPKKRVLPEQRSQWKPSKNASKKTCKFAFACPCCKGQKSKSMEIPTLGSAFKPLWLGGMLSKRTILMHEAQSCPAALLSKTICHCVNCVNCVLWIVCFSPAEFVNSPFPSKYLPKPGNNMGYQWISYGYHMESYGIMEYLPVWTTNSSSCYHRHLQSSCPRNPWPPAQRSQLCQDVRSIHVQCMQCIQRIQGFMEMPTLDKQRTLFKDFESILEVKNVAGQTMWPLPFRNFWNCDSKDWSLTKHPPKGCAATLDRWRLSESSPSALRFHHALAQAAQPDSGFCSKSQHLSVHWDQRYCQQTSPSQTSPLKRPQSAGSSISSIAWTDASTCFAALLCESTETMDEVFDPKAAVHLRRIGTCKCPALAFARQGTSKIMKQPLSQNNIQ